MITIHQKMWRKQVKKLCNPLQSENEIQSMTLFSLDPQHRHKCNEKSPCMLSLMIIRISYQLFSRGSNPCMIIYNIYILSRYFAVGSYFDCWTFTGKEFFLLLLFSMNNCSAPRTTYIEAIWFESDEWRLPQILESFFFVFSHSAMYSGFATADRYDSQCGHDLYCLIGQTRPFFISLWSYM